MKENKTTFDKFLDNYFKLVDEVAGLKDATVEQLIEYSKSEQPIMRMHIASHPHTPIETLLILSQDVVKSVREAVAENPNYTVVIDKDAISCSSEKLRTLGLYKATLLHDDMHYQIAGEYVDVEVEEIHDIFKMIQDRFSQFTKLGATFYRDKKAISCYKSEKSGVSFHYNFEWNRNGKIEKDFVKIVSLRKEYRNPLANLIMKPTEERVLDALKTHT
jgi:hypothetical protein